MKHARDQSRKRARTQWARMPLILKRNLKLLGGFIGNGEPPLCTRLTTNCDASGLGGFVRRYLSTRNLRITSNFFRCTMYLASHSVLCHCLVKQHSRNDKKKKKKKKIVGCQCTTKLTQVSSFSESHPSHGRARHQIRDWSESGRSRELLTPGTMTHAGRAASSPEIFRPFWPSVWPSSRSNFDLGPSPLDSTEKNFSYQSLWFWSAVFL